MLDGPTFLTDEVASQVHAIDDAAETAAGVRSTRARVDQRFAVDDELSVGIPDEEVRVVSDVDLALLFDSRDA